MYKTVLMSIRMTAWYWSWFGPCVWSWWWFRLYAWSWSWIRPSSQSLSLFRQYALSYSLFRTYALVWSWFRPYGWPPHSCLTWRGGSCSRCSPSLRLNHDLDPGSDHVHDLHAAVWLGAVVVVGQECWRLMVPGHTGYRLNHHNHHLIFLDPLGRPPPLHMACWVSNQDYKGCGSRFLKTSFLKI